MFANRQKLQRTKQTLEAESLPQRRAETLPAAQADIPREHVMLKLKDEDAEAVMAKALEGGSDSQKKRRYSQNPAPG